MDPAPPDFSRKHRAGPAPPAPDRLVTDINTPFVQQILDLVQRKWVVHKHHHRQTDHLG
jgi:hypothetical protein